MSKKIKEKSHSLPGLAVKEKHYKEIRRRHIIRLFLTYIAPLILLIVFFLIQYKELLHESQTNHLKSISENQGKVLDLFFRERLVNLMNLIDDPKIELPPANEKMNTYLQKLQKDSDVFIDIGFFDSTGVQIAYSGPLPLLQKKDYSHEPWWLNLKKISGRYLITDVYLGFRQKPHFTIAVSRLINNKYMVLRATLDPKKIYEYMTSIEGANDVYISIVNQKGYYQLVTPNVGKVLEASPIIPPSASNHGTENIKVGNETHYYAYSWLKAARWAVIVQKAGIDDANFLGGHSGIILISSLIIFGLFVVIVIRSKKYVQMEQEKDIVRTQLEHASKLASVGELAAGIAHEINNPLAIIASEAGLMKDLINPEFGQNTSLNDLSPHLENIHDAAFRGRDITRKLLGFVRQDDIKLELHQINDLINDIIDGFYGNEMAVSNIEIKKSYQDDIPAFITDGNQIKQVLLNIINNAVDAILPPGSIFIGTSFRDNNIIVEISDTGKGMTKEQISKIFHPFYTTKEVGKGTGLGLSVSLAIIKSLGGKIDVESISGKGSTFIISLPIIEGKK